MKLDASSGRAFARYRPTGRPRARCESARNGCLRLGKRSCRSRNRSAVTPRSARQATTERELLRVSGTASVKDLTRGVLHVKPQFRPFVATVGDRHLLRSADLDAKQPAVSCAPRVKPTDAATRSVV